MTNALILAAGQGSRLRPYTDNKPKALVNLIGKPIIERQIDVLRKNGINNISIAAGYCADQFNYLGLPIIVNEDFASTNMVHTFFQSLEIMVGDQDLIVAYGDIVYESNNLKKVLDSNADISLMIDMEWRKYWEARLDDPLMDVETLVLDAENNILEIGKKPHNYNEIHGQYTGLIKIRKNIIQALVDFYENLDQSILYDNQKFHEMYMTSLLQLLINQNWQVKGVIVKNGWLETDTVDDLKLYEALSKNGQLEQFCRLD